MSQSQGGGIASGDATRNKNDPRTVMSRRGSGRRERRTVTATIVSRGALSVA